MLLHSFRKTGAQLGVGTATLPSRCVRAGPLGSEARGEAGRPGKAHVGEGGDAPGRAALRSQRVCVEKHRRKELGKETLGLGHS